MEKSLYLTWGSNHGPSDCDLSTLALDQNANANLGFFKLEKCLMLIVFFAWQLISLQYLKSVVGKKPPQTLQLNPKLETDCCVLLIMEFYFYSINWTSLVSFLKLGMSLYPLIMTLSRPLLQVLLHPSSK